MIDLNELSLAELFEELTRSGSLLRLLQLAGDEDLGSVGDITTRSIIEPDRMGEASIVPRTDGVIAGLATVETTIDAFKTRLECELIHSDGDCCAADRPVGRVHGPLTDILRVERTLLNLLGRLSGIATITRQFVDAVAGTNAVICETRKTTPGLRAMEKYAVRCGGGTLHRLGLFDAALYKDNHLAHLRDDELTATLRRAIERARAAIGLRFVEVEVDRLEQLERLVQLPAGLVDFVLLDNMPLDALHDAVRTRDGRAPHLKLEASGNITLDTVRAIAETGVERISIGALTHSVTCLDIGFDLA